MAERRDTALKWFRLCSAWPPWALRARIVGLLAVIGGLGIVGCASPVSPRHPRQAADGVTVAGAGYFLQVVRVVSPTGVGSGIPLTRRLVLTAAHVCDRAMMAAVDGRPMAVVAEHARVQAEEWASFNRFEGRHADDWVLLAGTVGTLTPNPRVTAFRPPRGSKVLLGGYPTHGLSDDAWARRPATVMEGTVVGETRGPDGTQDTVRVRVPWGSYGGFSGGPAALVDECGALRVWGFVVGGGWNVLAPLSWEEYVAPLPEALANLCDGTGQVRAIVPPPPPGPGDGSELHTLHVWSESGAAAGCPVDARTVLVAGAQLRGHLLAASVESKPMVAVGDFERLSQVLSKAGGAGARSCDDWVLLSAQATTVLVAGLCDTKAPDFPVDLIDPAARPTAGGKVLVSGFLPAPPSETPLDFLARQPTVVEGVVLDSPPRSAREEGAAFVGVPAGDYSGFLGGPVAAGEIGGRSFRVWGVVVAWEAEATDSARARLIVAPISPADLAREPRDLPRVIHTLIPATQPAGS